MDSIQDRFEVLKTRLGEATAGTPAEIRRQQVALLDEAVRLINDASDEITFAEERVEDIRATFGFREHFLGGRLGGNRDGIEQSFRLQQGIEDRHDLIAEVRQWSASVPDILRTAFIASLSKETPDLAGLLSAGNIMVQAMRRAAELRLTAKQGLWLILDTGKANRSGILTGELAGEVTRLVNSTLDSFDRYVRSLGMTPDGLRASGMFWSYNDEVIEQHLNDITVGNHYIRPHHDVLAKLRAIRDAADDLHRAFTRDADDIHVRVSRIVDDAWDVVVPPNLWPTHRASEF